MESVAIISGGMDSVTMLYDFQENVHSVASFNYGSKHNKKELPFAKYHAEKLNKRHIVIDLPFINKFFKSSLLRKGDDIPDGHYEDDVMKKTAVPFRNGIMLSITAGIAESINCNRLMIANHFGDHAIYPDCRDSFIRPMAEAIRNGTYKNIELFSPYIDMTKREIAFIGKDLGIDYRETWSCYKGLDIHCGTCGTCVERKEALNGFDKTKYRR